MLTQLLRHGRAIGLFALAAGLLILVIDWTRRLDEPGEQIAESVVADIGGVALVITGAAILITLWAQRGDAGRFQRDGVATVATIEDIALNFFGTDVTLSFTDQAGQSQRVTLRGSNLGLRPGIVPGMQVGVRYDSANPRRLRFQDTLDTLAPRP